MDYVVGSVAALISGNVTPNRPKVIRKALTPIKHQQSPNVTPKSEMVVDRSIFLSPSVQKKKAIVKKSPKRIFQNPDTEGTEAEQNSSPKADKVKKHLKDDLESDQNLNSSRDGEKPKKGKLCDVESSQSANESTPKKKKKRQHETGDLKLEETDQSKDLGVTSKKKTKKHSQGLNKEISDDNGADVHRVTTNHDNTDNHLKDVNVSIDKKKRKIKNLENIETKTDSTKIKGKKSKVSKKSVSNYVNPNAITTKDTDSEHDSDDDIKSENEEENEKIFDTGPAEESSDEEENTKQSKTETEEKPVQMRTQDEVKRTLFVGNVPFSKKCKKEIKKMFNKYGDIETVRIRTVPVKDARVTPKLAVIKNELHPERTTVNVYVKFKNPDSVEQALSENNTVLNGCHLRVSRSESTGAEHDPNCSVFVGNIPFALEDEGLREKFEKCGEIVSVRIIRDKKTNAGKGFGYVNFSSRDGVELALALTEEDLTMKNRILRVKRCSQGAQKQKFGQESSKKNVGAHQRNNHLGKKVFKPGQKNEKVGEGAQRRLMHKRKNQEAADGPAEKRRNLNQPHREKKTRKEFVGMTAEKKKKHTLNKGLKKKRALSEIMSK